MFPVPERDGQLPERPHLKPWFRWALAGDDVVVEHGHTAHVLGGRAATTLLPRLLPLLDGTRTAADVAAALEVALDAILGAVRVLDELGLLLDGDPQAAAADAAVRALAASGLRDPAGVRAALQASEVAIVGDAPIGAAVEELLRASGVAVASRCDWDAAAGLADRAPAAFVVAVPAPDEVPRLDRWNAETVAAGGPAWLQVLPYDGHIAVVGPVIVPGETCCRACFVRRRAAASGYGLEFDALETVPTRAGGGPALDAIVAGVAAVTTLRWLVHVDASLPGVYHACERHGLALSEHRVLRVPRCPVCSEVRNLATPLPWFKEPGTEIPAPAVEAVR
jgi:bacteriocin biosynthesis cyclodehydratase domain-containing protein